MTRWLVLALVLVAAPAGAETLVDRGRYLVEGLGAWANCHTPKGPGGDLADKRFAGSFEVTDAFGTWIAPNITPDRETGIGGEVPEPSREDPVKYGEYLAGPVAHCVECHTPMAADGRPDAARPFAGGVAFVSPSGTVYSANLTADAETGLGRWTDAEIARPIVNGTGRTGGVLSPPMPWPYYAGRVTDADARAIVAYLRTLPAIANAVPPPRPRAR